MKKTKNLSVNSGTWIQVSMIFMLVFTLLLSPGCKKNEDTSPPVPPGLDDTTLFINANFRASHNSYSGNIDDGHRGSIRQQLDAGLRFVEFDIRHDGSQFMLGHLDIGDAVYNSHGNPENNNMKDWLHIVADWSRSNALQTPVILMLDMRNEFSTEHLDNLNKLVSDTLGSLLFRPRDFTPSKTLGELAGRVMVVLSGDETSRERYASNFKNESLIFFVEHQKGNSGLHGLLFYAAESPNCGWAQDVRGDKKFVRLWDVENDDCQNPAPNLPATSSPYFGWYARYCKKIHAIPDFNFATVPWHSEHKHDKGMNPDAAVNNSGFFVEVHQSETYSNQLWYNTGKIAPDGQTIQWFSVPNSSRHYDTGENPSVAINDNLILMETHGSENNNDLYCNIGRLDTLTGSIQWFHKAQYDEGEFPSVSINQSNIVVEVHQAHYSDKLWYNVGIVDEANKTITWGEKGEHRNYETGNSPSVAVYGNQVFELHNSSTYYIWGRIGMLDTTQYRIIWKDQRKDYTYSFPVEHCTSILPSVALYSNGALEVHLSSSSGIWWSTGKLSNTVMAMGPSENIQSSISWLKKISVAINEERAVLLYVNNSGDLLYRLGTIK